MIRIHLGSAGLLDADCSADVVSGSSCPFFSARGRSRQDAVDRLVERIAEAGFHDAYEVVGDESYDGPRRGRT